MTVLVEWSKKGSSWMLGYMLLHKSSFPFLMLKYFTHLPEFAFAIEIYFAFAGSVFRSDANSMSEYSITTFIFSFLALLLLEYKLNIKELMLLNCGVGEDSWESLGLQGDPTSQS